MLLRLHRRRVVLAIVTRTMFRLALFLCRAMLLTPRLVFLLRPRFGARHHRFRRTHDRGFLHDGSGGFFDGRRRFHRRYMVVELVGTELVLAIAVARCVAAPLVVVTAGLAVFAHLDVFHDLARDGYLGQAFDGIDLLVVARRRQHVGVAGASGAARAADAVDVVVGVERHVEIEHVAHGGNVEAARRHVAGDENLQFAGSEAVERLGAQRLIEIAVQRRGIEAVLGERFRHDIDVALAVAEDDARC